MMWKVTLSQEHKFGKERYTVKDETVFYFPDIDDSLIQLTRIAEGYSGRKTTIEIRSLSEEEYEAEIGNEEEK